MKKVIIIISSLLHLIAALSIIYVIKIGISWESGKISNKELFVAILIPLAIYSLLWILNKKFPNEDRIAKEVIHGEQDPSVWLITILCVLVLVGAVLLALLVS